MALPSPFRRRRVHNPSHEASGGALPASAVRPRMGPGLPLLWPWAANANRSKLSGITLAHVLSGDTVSPISFPEFEAFLDFCHIDHRARQDLWNRQAFNDNSEGSKQGREDVFSSRNGKTPLPLDVRPHILSEKVSPLVPRSAHPIALPFRDEVQNILATFFVPGSRKELSLSSEMRDNVIRDSSLTTHPDTFAPVYEAIYETVECVSLPRFLESASTNINRPRQLFWYFSALPIFLLGVALTLLFVLSNSERFVVPPTSHRAWRLISVPCFLLSSMMWYKGFRGFCPVLFLRSSRQLRPWELEQMVNDKEAQAFCISLSNQAAGEIENANNVPLTPITPSSYTSANARIAPFLDDGMDSDTTKEERKEAGTLTVSTSRSTESSKERDRGRSNEQFRSRAGNRYHRPPIFGPRRVVEDERIRAVHMHIWWSLVRFGLFWAMVSAAIVLAVPSLH